MLRPGQHHVVGVEPEGQHRPVPSSSCRTCMSVATNAASSTAIDSFSNG
jgi:hypothetical protein